MPRPNLGPQLVFLEKRRCWYVKWFKGGREKLASTGTADKEEARRVFNEFMESRLDLHPLAKVFRLPIEDIGASVKPKRQPTSVYFIGGDVGAIKIGITNDVRKRLLTLQIGSPIKLQVFATARGGHDLEGDYHRRFAPHRLHGEWFERHLDILAEIDRLVAVAEAGGEAPAPDLFADSDKDA